MNERSPVAFPAAEPYIPTPEDMADWEPREYGTYLGMVAACGGDRAKAWELRSDTEGFTQRLLVEGQDFLHRKGASGKAAEALSPNLPPALVAGTRNRAEHSSAQEKLFEDIWMMATGRIAPFFEAYILALSKEFPKDPVEDLYQEVLGLVDITARNAFNRGISDHVFAPEPLTLPPHHEDPDTQRLYVQIATLTERTFYLVGRSMQRKWETVITDIWKFGASITPDEDPWLRKNWPWLNTMLSEILGAVQPIMPEQRVQLGETAMEVRDSRCTWRGAETPSDRAKMDAAFHVGHRLKRADGGV